MQSVLQNFQLIKYSLGCVLFMATSATIDCDGWVLASLSKSEQSALIIRSFTDLMTTSGFVRTSSANFWE